MVQFERLFDDGESGVLSEGVEPGLIGSAGASPSRIFGAFDRAKDEERFVEAEIDPLHHVGVGETADDDRFMTAVFVDDFERLTEFWCLLLLFHHSSPLI
jgi:hypothetical protein